LISRNGQINKFMGWITNFRIKRTKEYIRKMIERELLTLQMSKEQDPNRSYKENLIMTVKAYAQGNNSDQARNLLKDKNFWSGYGITVKDVCRRILTDKLRNEYKEEGIKYIEEGVEKYIHEKHLK